MTKKDKTSRPATRRQSSMTPDERRLVWNSLLNADMTTRYWGRVTQRRERLEFSITVLIALISLSAVGSWMTDIAPWLWKGALILNAVLGTALTLIRMSRTPELMADLGSKCHGLLASYELLWAQLTELPEENIRNRCKELDLRKQEIYEKAIRLHHSKRLVRKIQKEVLKSRGLAQVA